MKRIFVTVFVFSLLAICSGSVVAQNTVDVVGAGSSGADGLYPQGSGQINLKNYYQKVSFEAIYWDADSACWRITDPGGGGWYYNLQNTTDVPQTGWVPDTGNGGPHCNSVANGGSVPGLAPGPTVYILTPVVVTLAGTSAANTSYPYSTSLNGKPLYDAGGGWKINWDATFSEWVISHSGVGQYSSSLNTALPPAGGWVLLAGSSPAPTLTGGVDPLPVELASFTAQARGASAELRWSTATEVNSFGFDIERRTAGSDWTRVAFVQSNGTSYSQHTYTYSDLNLSSGTYTYRLKQTDKSGVFKYSPQMSVTVEAPRAFSLGQNYPNPFNPSTTIQFTVPTDGQATLKVFNTLGQEVATLFNGAAVAGQYYSATFDASRLASGIYFSRLESGGKVQMKKMMLLK